MLMVVSRGGDDEKCFDDWFRDEKQTNGHWRFILHRRSELA